MPSDGASEVHEDDPLTASNRWWPVLALSALLGAVALLVNAGLAFRQELATLVPSGERGLVAITLVSGAVYYGRVAEASPRQLMLKQVYYVQPEMDEQGRPRGNRLVRRERNDWHAPASMVIPVERIALVEPVSEASRLGQLIAQESAQAEPGASGPASAAPR